MIVVLTLSNNNNNAFVFRTGRFELGFVVGIDGNAMH